jgi:two-component system cell cycle sensor histidine kinase/response regulator CckA
LAFSRRQMLQPRILDLNQVVHDIGEILRRLIGDDIDLVTVAQVDLGQVRADPGQIEQVIMNLAVNARDAMPQGGKLTLETANVDLDEDYVRQHVAGVPGQYVMLAVSDNGMGIDAETQAHIFEPFFTTKGPGKGTGLGLSTVYGIVKQSGGFVWVYSEPGHGTTFKIYLPRVEGTAEHLEHHEGKESIVGGAETVLVVEDDVQLRALVARVLRTQGYSVLEAPNGREALQLARDFTGEIHLVLTDVIMPAMSGLEFAAQIAVARPTSRVLYISGYPNGALAHEWVLPPNVTFLQKPFSIEMLNRKVRELLDKVGV